MAATGKTPATAGTGLSSTAGSGCAFTEDEIVALIQSRQNMTMQRLAQYLKRSNRPVQNVAQMVAKVATVNTEGYLRIKR
jgi:hypothetical protein